MKVDVEELSPVKKIMHVEIPEKDVGRQLDKAYKNLKGSIKLKGFRPGKVPLSLKKDFGNRFMQKCLVS
ncbi:MAG: trigger factor family protein [Deltaproteobacteria bacterium]|nr:trigger factor family protein [Deltaproteobacteria bacterium]